MRLLNIIDREKNDNKKRVCNRKRVCDQKLLFLLKEVRNLLICRALKIKGCLADLDIAMVKQLKF